MSMPRDNLGEGSSHYRTKKHNQLQNICKLLTAIITLLLGYKARAKEYNNSMNTPRATMNKH